jgi:hypothetical protein
MSLIFFKVVFVFILVLVFAYFFCQERYRIEYAEKSEWDIPLEHLRPEQDFKTFYENRETILHDFMLNTRKKYEKQPFIGSIMTNGFHIIMPPNTKWEDHMIVSSHIQEVG